MPEQVIAFSMPAVEFEQCVKQTQGCIDIEKFTAFTEVELLNVPILQRLAKGMSSAPTTPSCHCKRVQQVSSDQLSTREIARMPRVELNHSKMSTRSLSDDTSSEHLW
jgi:hypothetical protein